MRPLLAAHRRAERHRASIEFDAEVGARYRRHAGAIEPQVQPRKRDLERRGAGRVPQGLVGRAERACVERAPDRYAERLMSPSACILHRRQQSRPHHGHRRHAVSLPRRQERRHRIETLGRNEPDSIARLHQGRLGPKRVEQDHVGAPDDRPAAWGRARIDTGLPPGDPHRPRRHAQTRGRAARGHNRIGHGSQVGEARHEAQHEREVRGGGVRVHDGSGAHARAFGDLGQVRPVGPAVDDGDLHVTAGERCMSGRESSLDLVRDHVALHRDRVVVHGHGPVAWHARRGRRPGRGHAARQPWQRPAR